MPSVYIGSSLHNAKEVQYYRDKFISNGIHVTYDWTTHGQVHEKEDLAKFGAAEAAGVKSADLFFMIPPARYGSHIELGIAIGCEKPVILVLDPQMELKTFYFLPNVYIFDDKDTAFNKALEMLI